MVANLSSYAGAISQASDVDWKSIADAAKEARELDEVRQKDSIHRIIMLMMLIIRSLLSTSSRTEIRHLEGRHHSSMVQMAHDEMGLNHLHQAHW